MEEKTISWRAKLAKSNINILDLRDNKVFLEFTYHPRPGTFKWCKTYFRAPYRRPELGEESLSSEDLAAYILEQVLTLRKELEG